jgi:hypothetical protein
VRRHELGSHVFSFSRAVRRAHEGYVRLRFSRTRMLTMMGVPSNP